MEKRRAARMEIHTTVVIIPLQGATPGRSFTALTRDVAIASDDDRHGLAGVANDIDGHGTMRRRRERSANRHRRKQVGNLRAGEDRFDAVHRLSGAGVDRADTAMRHRTAQKGDMQNIRNIEIIDETAFAAQQRLVLDARDAAADQRWSGRRHLAVGALGRLAHLRAAAAQAFEGANPTPAEREAALKFIKP